jgi:hypothetical protein
LSSHPTQRSSRSWCRPRVRAAVAVTSPSTRTSSSRPGDALLVQMLQHQPTSPVLRVEAGRTSAPTGSPVTSPATARLAPLGGTVGAAAVVEGEPAVGRPHARWVSMTTNRDRVRYGRRVGPCAAPSALEPGAVARPAANLPPHPSPGPERLRQEPPLAAGMGDAQHRVHHPPEVRCVRRSELTS